MPNTFRKSKLHNAHANMLTQSLNPKAMGHEMMQAKKPVDVLNLPVMMPDFSVLETATNPSVCIYRSGDDLFQMLNTLPLCEAIKDKYPLANIIYVSDNLANVTYLNIVGKQWYISSAELLEEAKLTSFRLSMNVTNIGGNGKPLYKELLEYAGFDVVEWDIDAPIVHEQYMAHVSKASTWPATSPHIPARLVILDVSCQDPTKAWPVQKYRELITQLKSKYKDLRFVVYDPYYQGAWPDDAEKVNLLYSHAYMAALIKKSVLFIGPDNGNLQLAGMLGKQAIGLFGSTDPAIQVGHFDSITSVESITMCKHCWSDSCRLAYSCMQHISVVHVHDAVVKLDSAYDTTNHASIYVGYPYTDTVQPNFIGKALVRSLDMTSLFITPNAKLNAVPHASMLTMEVIDVGGKRGKKSAGVPVGYVNMSTSRLTADKIDYLTSFKHLFVHSEKIKSLLLSKNIKIPLTVIPLPIPVYPRPLVQSYNSEFGDGDSLGCIVDSAVAEKNVMVLIDAFVDTFKDNSFKHLRILVDDNRLDKINAHISDKRITAIRFTGRPDWYNLLHTLECFIDLDSDAMSYYALTALAAGVYVMCPQVKLSYLPKDIVSYVPTKYGIYDLDGLAKQLDTYEMLHKLLTADAPRRVKYVIDNHAPKDVALSFVKILKEI